jgi:glucose/mannose transport system substrate-binding protein
LRENDPPDSFQVHPGGELVDYLDAGQLADLNDQFAQWSLFDVLPTGLLDASTVNGRIYSVPVGIHRLLLWSNLAALATGITTSPRPSTSSSTTWTRSVPRASITRSRSARIGPSLNSSRGSCSPKLGPERFETLWTAKADWSGGDVTGVLDDYKRLLSYSNPDRDNLPGPTRRS